MKLYRSITVGVSPAQERAALSEGSRCAVAQARWLAERTGASLSLLHSTYDQECEENDGAPAAPMDFVATLEALAKECTQAGVETTIHYSTDRPWLALTKRVLKTKSELAIVGKHDSSKPREMGINTTNLLRNSPGPVWVVDPHTEPAKHCILAATDLSPVGERVTQMAAYLAAESGSEFHIVHAWQRSMHDQLRRDFESEEELEERISAKEARITESILDGLGEIRERVTPILHVGCTTPERAIREGLEALHPELVVMGTLSRTGVPGLLIGNTAERLVRTIPCSLLTIKPKGFVSPVSM